jgi:hypothetical protein
MTEAELKSRLAQILAEEDRTPANWDRVELLCHDLSRELRADVCDTCPEHVYHFIADCDIRRRDTEYAEAQRANLRGFLGD